MNLRTARSATFAADPAKRRLGWAFAASVAIHGALLWPDPLPRSTAELSQPLAVTLRPPQRTIPEADLAPVPAVAAPRSLTSVRTGRERRATPQLTVESGRKLPGSPSAAEPALERESTQVPAEASRWPSEPDLPMLDRAAVHRTAPATEASPEGADGEALRQFRIAVARRVGHHDYPELAEEIGAGNASVVRVVVGPAPGMANVAVAQSSGYFRLDAKARELIGAGVRATTLPEALRGREFVTEFRVEFRPRDESQRN